MSDQTGRPSKLVLLVGSNPLPNYVAATMLKPSQVILLYTDATDGVAERLRQELMLLDSVERVRCTPIADPLTRAGIDEACDRHLADADLHYTGGTKMMATHVHRLWSEKGGSGRASYLSDERAQLLFDHATARDIDVAMSFDALARLHDVHAFACNPLNDEPLGEACELVARAELLERPGVAAMVNEAVGNDSKLLRDHPERLEGVPCVGTRLAELLVRADPTREGVHARWSGVLRGGGWLEVIVARALGLVLSQDSRSAVGHSLKGKLAGRRQFELDVAAVRGHRLYAGSCKTGNLHASKAKLDLFEVATRARQLGGDLARYALITSSPADSFRTGDVKDDVAAAWNLPNPPEVFGRRDLEEWARGELGSLEQWLGA